MKEIVRFIIFVVGLTMGCSCKDNASPVVKLFKAHMEKEISLEGFKEVYSEQDTLLYGDFRKRHPFLFVSYIDEECGSCVVKIREWYKRSESLLLYDKLAYVFVFRGEDYRKFLKYRVGKHPAAPFFYLSSEEFTYIINNPDIDRQVIDGGFLLDEKNRIKVIGSPLEFPSLRKLIEKKLYE
jgi:hypothetical protein